MKRKPKRPHAKDRPARVRGAILAAAELSSDAQAAARYGVTDRSIKRWRAQLEQDGELAQAYSRAMRKIEDRWLGTAARAFDALAARLLELAPAMAPDEAVHALEKLGDVLVQARALGAYGASDGESEDGREGPSTDANPQGLGALTTH